MQASSKGRLAGGGWLGYHEPQIDRYSFIAGSLPPTQTRDIPRAPALPSGGARHLGSPTPWPQSTPIRTGPEEGENDEPQIQQLSQIPSAAGQEHAQDLPRKRGGLKVVVGMRIEAATAEDAGVGGRQEKDP